jgi:hypothetical protein
MKHCTSAGGAVGLLISKDGYEAAMILAQYRR